jgi:hypothetical protein
MRVYYIDQAGDGGYQRLILSGWTERSSSHGPLAVIRVGPFTPPLSVGYNALIATGGMRAVIMQSGFSGIKYRRVVKKHIGRWEWKSLEEADHIRGEPENFMLSLPHDEACSQEIGELFELRLRVGCRLIRGQSNKKRDRIVLTARAEPNLELFYALHPGGKVPMCTDVFRSWIDSLEDVGRWIKFVPAELRIVGGEDKNVE